MQTSCRTLFSRFEFEPHFLSGGQCRSKCVGPAGRTKRKKRELPRAFKGSRTPGSNRYRCFLSDLTGLAAKPPSDFPKIRGGEGGI